jgi:ATP-dependent RNA helicase RhlE
MGRNERPCRASVCPCVSAENNLNMTETLSLASTGFDRFDLHEALHRGIHSAGFRSPRPIQNETIPAALEGRDVLGLAQTGTGKTAAFALPILDRLLDGGGPGPRVLILAPTRELASQIAAEIGMLARFTPLRTVTIYGGVSTMHQITALRRGTEIVVGCPGRVLDLLQQGALRLGNIETLVLDEADHMFDMGFLRDIRKILKALPKQRQNLLFSATMPSEIRGLADEVLHRPHVVELSDATPASTIDHALYPVAEARKRDLLEALLNADDCHSAIVFTRTKQRAKRLADALAKGGHRAVALQGNMSQNARDRAMGGFRARRFDILVATDIAARGIDVSGVSHVINYDVPTTPEAYTHRIGRTGRAELEGIACTFVTHEDSGWVRATERMIGEPIARRQVEGFRTAAPERNGNGGSTRIDAPRRSASRPAQSRPAASRTPARAAVVEATPSGDGTPRRRRRNSRGRGRGGRS